MKNDYTWQEGDTVLLLSPNNSTLFEGPIVENLEEEIIVQFPPTRPDGDPCKQRLIAGSDNFVVLVHEEEIPPNTAELLSYLSEQLLHPVRLCKDPNGHAFMAYEGSLKTVYMRERTMTSHDIRLQDDKWTRSDGEIREGQLVFVVEGAGEEAVGLEVEAPDFYWES